MLACLAVIAREFRFGRQEDSHEFLRYLLDGMQDSCLYGHEHKDPEIKATNVINTIFGCTSGEDCDGLPLSAVFLARRCCSEIRTWVVERRCAHHESCIFLSSRVA